MEIAAAMSCGFFVGCAAGYFSDCWGRVYVFKRTEDLTGWEQRQKLEAPESNNALQDNFTGFNDSNTFGHGKLDFRGLKRSTATASAVAGASRNGYGPKKLLDLGREDYVQLYNKLRRTSKF